MADNFFSSLRKAREEKQISLAEISDATLINLKTLEALERGDTKALPQAYVRAFIREYAMIVGLDKDRTMEHYDAWLQGAVAGKTEAPVVQKTVQGKREKKKPELVEPVTEPRPTHNTMEWLIPMVFKLALAVGALVLLNIVLWNWFARDEETPAEETPFLDVVKENERRADTSSFITHERLDSARVQAPVALPGSTVMRVDSMTLVAIATDSVWMEIVADDDVLTEHYLLPNSRLTWKAKDEFWITAIGNPAAIRFTLDNKPITFPYKPGLVARDVRVTRDSVFIKHY